MIWPKCESVARGSNQACNHRVSNYNGETGNGTWPTLAYAVFCCLGLYCALLPNHMERETDNFQALAAGLEQPTVVAAA